MSSNTPEEECFVQLTNNDTPGGSSVACVHVLNVLKLYRAAPTFCTPSTAMAYLMTSRERQATRDNGGLLVTIRDALATTPKATIRTAHCSVV